MRFALQCYVDESLHEAVKAAADASHMSVSRWLKLAVIGAIEGQDEAAFRDRLMNHLIYASTAADGLLLVHADKDLRTRVQVAHGKRLREYRVRTCGRITSRGGRASWRLGLIISPRLRQLRLVRHRWLPLLPGGHPHPIAIFSGSLILVPLLTYESVTLWN